MDISTLKPRERVLLEDGAVVEVIAPSDDGASVTVRYLESPFDPALVGTEARCTDYEIVAYIEGERVQSSE
jgi:hypothetical protein